MGAFFAANAQTETLPLDEQGKMIYYEVVTQQHISVDSLKARAFHFFKISGKADDLKLKASSNDSTMVANGKFVINKTTLVMSHPSGEINYQFWVELKAGKYRFWLTDFNFIPYQRDRYGNFVASTSIGIALETAPTKALTNTWKEYQAQTAKSAKAIAVKFKAAMANQHKGNETVEEKKVVKKEW